MLLVLTKLVHQSLVLVHSVVFHFDPMNTDAIVPHPGQSHCLCRLDD